jgi:hypothetical protein
MFNPMKCRMPVLLHGLPSAGGAESETLVHSGDIRIWSTVPTRPVQVLQKPLRNDDAGSGPNSTAQYLVYEADILITSRKRKGNT